MSRSSFTLAALATVAIPGLDLVAAKHVASSTDFDVAEVVDSGEHRWVIKSPRSVIAGAAMEGEVALLENLAAATDEGELPFEVPRPRGFAPLPEGGRAMVYPLIAGRPLNVARLSAIAPQVAGAIAALHALPTQVVEDTGLPTFTADEYRERRLNEIDEAAKTGKVPTVLLHRWESACEDVQLWRFCPTVVHGDLTADHVLVRQARVVGVVEWASAHVGDPAQDLAPLLAQAPESAMDGLLNAYAQARGVDDEYLLARAVLASELALLRWLMHGVRTQSTEVIEDAVGMLSELAGIVESAEPIVQIGREPDPGEPDPPAPGPVPSAAAPGSAAIPLGEHTEGGVGPDDEMPTVEIRREDLEH